ncbi:hypothetical protein V5N11_002427 [Cardamine amara subsp. amara]|uniref:Uncharacterized protein n=1 Tax=Cardamine amara subsp. amara TaxID=228776 RepID=A0ABD1C0E2_CARAN
MARFIVTVLLFTLAISVASSKPENDIIPENHTPLSAKPNPDSTNPTLPGSDEVTIPLNFVKFHPINRHFPRRPLTTSRFNRRPCHHHRHKLWGRGLQISYGNDMIFSGKEEKPTGTDHLSNAFVMDIPTIKILVGPFLEEEEDDGSKKITVKLVKRKEEGEDRKDYYKSMFTTKIRKILNHVV